MFQVKTFVRSVCKPRKKSDFIKTEISLWWSGITVSNNLLSLKLPFWLVRKLSIQCGLWDWTHVCSFIRGDKSYVYIKLYRWEFSIDILKSPKITKCSCWCEYSLLIFKCTPDTKGLTVLIASPKTESFWFGGLSTY